MAAMDPNLVYNLDGTLDMRCRKNKLWLAKQQENQIKNLREELDDLKTKKSSLETRVLRQNKTIKELSGGKEKELDPEDCDCAICMEPMKGKVTLRCGHEMCPDCFAQHARQNNTCPFCREEFSCKPKKRREQMSDVVVDAIVDDWSRVVSVHYFARQSESNNNKTTSREKYDHLRWLVTANSKLIIKNRIRPWYENEV
tara:strand:+ start:2391 stop:2987 length:597 start_codon:yes stop_codon:yes gene_type:complete